MGDEDEARALTFERRREHNRPTVRRRRDTGRVVLKPVAIVYHAQTRRQRRTQRLALAVVRLVRRVRRTATQVVCDRLELGSRLRQAVRDGQRLEVKLDLAWSRCVDQPVVLLVDVICEPCCSPIATTAGRPWEKIRMILIERERERAA